MNASVTMAAGGVVVAEIWCGASGRATPCGKLAGRLVRFQGPRWLTPEDAARLAHPGDVAAFLRAPVMFDGGDVALVPVDGGGLVVETVERMKLAAGSDAENWELARPIVERHARLVNPMLKRAAAIMTTVSHRRVRPVLNEPGGVPPGGAVSRVPPRGDVVHTLPLGDLRSSPPEELALWCPRGHCTSLASSELTGPLAEFNKSGRVRRCWSSPG